MLSVIYITGVRSCYDEGKRVAETLMFDYHRQHGIGKIGLPLSDPYTQHTDTPTPTHIHSVTDGMCKIVHSLPLPLSIWNSTFQCTLTLFWNGDPITEIRIARIFNTYGPRMNIDDGRVVSNFIAQAIR